MKMKGKKFKARNGSPFKVKDAQKIGEEIEKIRKKGSLNPAKVVEKARDEKSILNRYFDWDNTKAAEKWRLQQARMIVNHIIEVVVIQGKEEEIRCWVAVVTEKDENVYVTNAEVISTPSYKKQVLSQMESTLERLLRLIKLFSSME